MSLNLRQCRDDFDPERTFPLFECGEEFVALIGTNLRAPSTPSASLAAVVLDRFERRVKHLAILDGFIGDLQAEDLVDLNVDHNVYLIHLRLTFHFSRIHSLRLVTLFPVLSTVTMTSSARISGVTLRGDPEV